MATIQHQLMTADELLRLPDDDMRHELVRGVLTTMTPAGGDHGRVASKLGRVLGAFIEDNDLGESYAAETGFVLHISPDTVRAPDFAFIGKGRLAPGPNPGFFKGAPDLAVEVLSPNDRSAEVQRKIDEYFAAGARQVWIVDGNRRTIAIHTPDGPPRTLNESDAIDGGDLLPGFSARVSQLLPKPND